MTPTLLEGRFDRTLAVTGPVRLEVETDAGTVRVSTGEAGAVRVRGIVRARSSLFGLVDPESHIQEIEENPPIEQDGNRIRVTDRVSNGLFSGHPTILLDITVPPDTSVRAKADSGGIRIEGVQGPVECSTDSGFVEVVGAGSRVKAQADSGRIEIRQATGPVQAEVDSGDIQVLEIGGEIEVKSDSGEIQLSQTVAARVRVQADSGRIRLRLAPGAGYTLRAKSDSGHIQVPEMSRQRSSKHEVFGDIHGGGPSVQIQVDSGDIDIE
jgi:DUF4097 and DUF4098 domain-containing protein YvlB